MRDDERLHDVIRMLYEYSARPPLKFPSEAEIPEDCPQNPRYCLWAKIALDQMG